MFLHLDIQNTHTHTHTQKHTHTDTAWGLTHHPTPQTCLDTREEQGYLTIIRRRGGYSPTVLVYSTTEHSKNKQDNTFCRDYFFLLAVYLFLIV